MLDTLTKEPGDVYRHWSRESQAYAPGDVLIHYLETGWTAGSFVTAQSFYFASNRQVTVLRFTLTQGEQTLTMPVIDNPKIEQLLKAYGIVPVTSSGDMIHQGVGV